MQNRPQRARDPDAHEIVELYIRWFRYSVADDIRGVYDLHTSWGWELTVNERKRTFPAPTDPAPARQHLSLSAVHSDTLRGYERSSVPSQTAEEIRLGQTHKRGERF